MKKIPFVDGTKTQEAYVTVNEQNYQVTPAVWTGNTPKRNVGKYRKCKYELHFTD